MSDMSVVQNHQVYSNLEASVHSRDLEDSMSYPNVIVIIDNLHSMIIRDLEVLHNLN